METHNKLTSARYQVEQDTEETWQVVDTMSGLPAASNGKDFVLLSKKDAADLATELNACEMDPRKSPLL